MSKIEVAKIKEVAQYDPNTGFIVRIAGRAVRRDAVRVDTQGYGRVCFFGTEMAAHRVAWALHHGQWPEGSLDHINGNRLDNRIDNLRLASPLENARNKARSVKNTSGAVGVSWHKKRRRWQAYIDVMGRMIALGMFASFEEAFAARKAAESVHGFHVNHGR